MPEPQVIPEREAYELIRLGSKMASDVGGEVARKMFPIFYGGGLAGYGISFDVQGLSDRFSRELSNSFARLLEEDYIYRASTTVSRYLTPIGNQSAKKNSLKISNRNQGRRSEFYMTPHKLPEPKKITPAEAIEKSINRLLSSKDSSSLSLPLPWQDNLFYVKQLGYTPSDMLGCGDFKIDVRMYYPNFFDILNITYNVGVAISDGKIEKKERRFAKTMKALLLEKFEKMKWTDIAGLEELKNEFRLKLQGPMLNDSLYKNLKIEIPNTLIIGPPGTGKTMMSTALINDMKDCNVVPFKPEFIAPFIGRSEGAVGELFSLCNNLTKETGKYTILYWDEMDDIGSRFEVARDKVTNALLRLLGGSEKYGFSILGTTNRPTDLDPALFRSGRIDWMVYLGLPNKSDRHSILEKYCKELGIEDVDMDTLASETDKFTGADISGLCKETVRQAISRAAEKDIEKIVSLSPKDVRVLDQDFRYVLKRDGPSIVANNNGWENVFSGWVKTNKLEHLASYG